MFNIKPPSVPGFRVGLVEDQPGFAINDDGSTRSAPTAGSAVPGLGGYFSGDALQAATDVGDIQPAASANDPQGLKMANDAAREAGLDTPELRQKFHPRNHRSRNYLVSGTLEYCPANQSRDLLTEWTRSRRWPCRRHCDASARSWASTYGGSVKVPMTSLRLEFGNPHLVVQEPMQLSQDSSRTVIDALGRRIVEPAGKWHLFIEDGDWAIVTRSYGTRRFDADRARADATLRQLDGQKLTSVDYLDRTGIWYLKFDLGGSLTISRSHQSTTRGSRIARGCCSAKTGPTFHSETTCVRGARNN